MKITIFAKKNKPHIKAVINVLKQRGDNVTAFLGERGDLFPEEAKNIESDLVLSYLSPWIVPKHILEKTTKWNINFHPGPPEYPGIGCFNFALYDEANEYGVTAHIMEEKVDSG
ncbi:MAG: hypothetical protein KAR20_23550, partial [Candidatus Heimdallarchaeota archaeon]|nr:hypothetical protein [Candidatus Heimdallarchaeota archaeon]